MATNPRCPECGQVVHGDYCLTCADLWNEYMEEKNT